MPELLDVNSDVGEWEQSWPHILPGEEHLLFTVQPTNGTALDGHINLLALETGESRTLIRRAYNARYVPSGHIVFMRSGSLWAVPFDREQLEVTGPEVPVVSGVHSASNRGTAVYAFSDNGILIYMSGIDVWNSPTRQSTAVWVNRDGQEEPTAVPPGNYSRLRISPNGTHVALQDTDGSSNSDIWIYDLDRGMPLRLTFDPAVDDDPVWTPDGEYVVFWSERDGGGLFRKAANGSGSVEFLAAASTESGSFIPFSFSPDGQQLVVVTWPPPNDLWVLTFGDNQLVPLLQAETDERAAAVSPDGYWIAYEAELPAGDQIIVQPFPNVGDGMWQVTTSGGGRPFWGSTERDLFYTDYDGSIASVTLEMDIDDLNVQVVNQSTIVPLNAATYVAEKGIAPDGSRFLVHKRVGQRVATSDQTSLVVVENWFEELNRLAPPAE